MIDFEQFDISQYFKQYNYNSELPFVPFYGNKGQDLFGNFWIMSKQLTYCNVTANNTEALYHSAKFIDLKIKQKFNDISPIKAFYLSRFYHKFIREDWNKIKDKVMLEILRLKFYTGISAIVLLATGNKFLVEHTPIKGRDSYWSDNFDGSGQNKLGLLLMQIREELGGHGIVNRPIEYYSWIKTN